MNKEIRSCISCRRLAHKTTFWRVVRLANRAANLKGHAWEGIALEVGVGRSAYLCPCAACLQQARKKNRLSRALRTHVPDLVYEQLQDRLAKVES